MLLPTTLPRTTDVRSARHDRMLTASSGALVPNATIVRPTTRGGMPSTSASLDAPRTSPWEPTTSNASPPRISATFEAIDDRSGLDEDLEAAVGHPLRVERHLLRHRRHAGILHDLRVDPVAVGARLVDDVGEDRDLPGLELHRLGKRAAAVGLQIVPDALHVVDRAVLHPQPLAPLRHLLVGPQVLAGHREQESIHIRHRNLPLFSVFHGSGPARGA